MPKPVYKERYARVLWNEAVHTDREVIGNRPDFDRLGNTRTQKFRAKGSRKGGKVQKIRYRESTNVEYEIHDYTKRAA
jgi:hypothetical protein